MSNTGKVKTGLPPGLSLVFRSVVSAGILFYLSQHIDWALLGELLLKVRVGWLATAFFILGLAFVAAAARWYCLLQIQDIALTLRATTVLTFIGAFFNTFFLGSTGGDVAKLVYVFKKYPDKKANATLSVIMDRVFGLGVLLCIALFFIVAKFDTFIHMASLRMAIIGVVTSFVVLLLLNFFMLAMPFEKLPVAIRMLWFRIPRHDILATLLRGFRQHRYARKKLYEAIFFSILVQLLVFVSAFALTKAIYLDISFINLAIIITIVTCIISLPVSIGGHGLREGAFLLMFSLFSAANSSLPVFDNEQVILFSLAYFMLGLGWSAIGGIVYLLIDPLKTIGYTDNPN